jgi:hypothetical protein
VAGTLFIHDCSVGVLPMGRMIVGAARSQGRAHAVRPADAGADAGFCVG